MSTSTQPSWTVTSLRWVKLDGAYSPAYLDCDMCRGHGWVYGGDEQQPCPACSLRFSDFQRTYAKVAP